MTDPIHQFDQHVRDFSQSQLSRPDLIANFAMGLAGEAGEVVDLLKKHLYHGDPLDLKALESEMGDVLWYWFALLQQFDLDLEDAMSANIAKLRSRHEGRTFNREAQARNKANGAKQL